MTKRDFFILIIKLFGLFSLVTSLFTVLPQYFSYLTYREEFFSYSIIVGITLMLGGFFLILIFKAPGIVKFLKLDQSFDDERIDFGNLRSESIIKISCLIIGGLMIVNNLPTFLINAYNAFRDNVNNHGFLSFEDTFYFWMSLINVIVGYLLITNVDLICRFFVKKTDLGKS